MFKNIDQLKSQLDAHRPLPESVVKNLHEDLLLRWTYHSNAIEGNTLTLLETKVVLEGITIGGKSLREHFEAINHREAILYIEDLVKDDDSLSEWQIKNIHQLVLKNVDDTNAGKYRQVNVMISGANHTPPDHTQLTEQMEAFIQWYQQQSDSLHPVERAAKVHADFVGIHPFTDGNGRTSRLLMNLELMKSGFPPCIITVEQRLDYYQALDHYHTSGRMEKFVELIANCVEESFKPYWHALSIQPN